MPRIEQVSFGGGEISPALYGRTDIQKYNSSVAYMHNWFVHAHGGCSTRAGFEYIGRASDTHDFKTRLIEFQFNTEQNYVLAFGEQQMRVIRNGGFVVSAEIAITSISKSNPAVVTTAVAHNLVNGDEVYISDIIGMKEMDERLLEVSNVTATTFELAAVDSTNYSDFTSGNMAWLYQVPTPYTSDELPLLKYTQSADVMILTHPNHPPYRLTRSAGEPNSIWTIEQVVFGSNLKPPVVSDPVVTGTDSTAAPKDYGYVVTTVDAGGSESIASNGVTVNMSAQSTTYGAKIEWNNIESLNLGTSTEVVMTGHPFVTGDKIKLTGLFESDGTTPLTDPDGVVFHVVYVDADTFKIMSEDGEDEINSTAWTHAANTGYANYNSAGFYNIYKLNSVATGIYGYIGQSETNQFSDFNLGPDMSVTPPSNNNPFKDGNDPFCTTFHQQRLWYGGVKLSPQTIFASKSGDFQNFDLSNPVRSDDSIEVTLATRQVNEIRHLVSIGPLIALTSGGVWRIDGDADGVITPKTISTKNQGERGCSHVPPVLVGDTVLFIQSLNGKIRDLGYQYESDKYTGNDLTIFAEHLFYGYQIVDWCYAEEPHTMVWCVRDDGVLLSLAYLKEQNVWGWSQHSTNGWFESVCSVSEGNEDVVYAVVRREVGGQTRRFIERLHERRFSNIESAFCVDSGLYYEGEPTTRIIGLDHLEGETLVALADGQVVKNLTVSNGEIELPYEATKVSVGYNYTCDIQTLEINIDSQTLRTLKKAIPRVGLMVRDTRGLKVGANPERLYETKERQPGFNYDAIPNFTGEVLYQSDIGWQDEGARMWLRQDYPLPATILSIIPELTS